MIRTILRKCMVIFGEMVGRKEAFGGLRNMQLLLRQRL
jgi:hypothetical protein